MYNFVKNKKDGRKYSLNTVFYENVSDSKTVAWEMDKTIHQVEKVMNNNNILVTKLTSVKKGKFYDISIIKAKTIKNQIDKSAKNLKKYYPKKEKNLVINNVSKHGGYTSGNISYSSIVKFTVENKGENKTLKRVIPISIKDSILIRDINTLEKYLLSKIEKEKYGRVIEFKLLYAKFKENTLIKKNNYIYFSGGRSNDTFYYNNAMQLLLDKESEKYIKILFKYKNDREIEKNTKDIEIPKKITHEECNELYQILIDKMNSDIGRLKYPNKYNELSLENIIEKFTTLELNNKVYVLLDILDMLTNKNNKYKHCGDLLGVKYSRAQQSYDLTKLNQFSIIEQSVTGFYEKEITIIGDKENDVENNNS